MVGDCGGLVIKITIGNNPVGQGKEKKTWELTHGYKIKHVRKGAWGILWGRWVLCVNDL